MISVEAKETHLEVYKEGKLFHSFDYNKFSKGEIETYLDTFNNDFNSKVIDWHKQTTELYELNKAQLYNTGWNSLQYRDGETLWTRPEIHPKEVSITEALKLQSKHNYF